MSPPDRKRATALHYEGGHGAPKVVATGQGLIAERILEIAAAAGRADPRGRGARQRARLARAGRADPRGPLHRGGRGAGLGLPAGPSGPRRLTAGRLSSPYTRRKAPTRRWRGANSSAGRLSPPNARRKAPSGSVGSGVGCAAVRCDRAVAVARVGARGEGDRLSRRGRTATRAARGCVCRRPPADRTGWPLDGSRPRVPARRGAQSPDGRGDLGTVEADVVAPARDVRAPVLPRQAGHHPPSRACAGARARSPRSTVFP